MSRTHLIRQFVLIAAAFATAMLVRPSAEWAGLSPAAASTVGSSRVSRGRYVAKIAGCNDCHTPGYVQSAGTIPESQWLIGDTLGWQGPWGTTYPVNL